MSPQNWPGMKLETVEACTSCRSTNARLIATQGEFGLRQCHECSLLFVSPRPTAEELTQIYTEEYFEGSGDHGNPDGYLQQASGYQTRASLMVDWISSLTKLNQGYWVDIGCGPGFIVQACQKKGFRATGLDVSEAAVKFGREDMGLDLRVCVAEQLLTEITEEAQVVTLFDCLFHLPEPREAVRQIHQILAPGGWMVAGPFDLHPEGWTPPNSIPNLHELGIPEHLSFVNQTSMATLLKQLEFREVKFVPLPQTPSEVVSKRLGCLPGPAVKLLRSMVRRVAFLQRLVHRAASTQLNLKAGYVIARK